MLAVVGRRIHTSLARAQLQREFGARPLDCFGDILVSSAAISPGDLRLMLPCDEPEDIVKAIFSYHETRSPELSEAEQEIRLEL
jgi:hypothetical protein